MPEPTAGGTPIVDTKAILPPKPNAVPSVPKPPTGGMMGQLEVDHAATQEQLQGLTDQYVKDRDAMMQDMGQMPKRTPDDPMQAFSSVGAMIGVFGSLLTKRPLTAALSSIAAAQKAQHAGNLEEYRSKVAEWEMHNKYINSIQNAISTNVKNIMENNKTTWNEKMAMLKLEVANNAANSRMFMQNEQMTMRWAQMQMSLGEFMQRQQSQQSEHNSTTFTSLLARFDPKDYPGFIERYQQLPPNATQSDVLAIFTGKPGKQTGGNAGAAAAADLANEARAALSAGRNWEHGGYTYTPKDLKDLNNPSLVTSPKLQTLAGIFKKASLTPSTGGTTTAAAPSTGGTVAKQDETLSEDAMAELRKLNPGMSDADLITEHNQYLATPGKHKD